MNIDKLISEQKDIIKSIIIDELLLDKSTIDYLKSTNNLAIYENIKSNLITVINEIHNLLGYSDNTFPNFRLSESKGQILEYADGIISSHKQRIQKILESDIVNENISQEISECVYKYPEYDISDIRYFINELYYKNCMIDTIFIESVLKQTNNKELLLDSFEHKILIDAYTRLKYNLLKLCF